jgi:hypothetical protein
MGVVVVFPLGIPSSPDAGFAQSQSESEELKEELEERGGVSRAKQQNLHLSYTSVHPRSGGLA